MFKALLARQVPMLYAPGMVVQHHVEPWRLRRRYFLRLHFDSGRKWGQYQTEDYPRTVAGVPPFMVAHALRHWVRAAACYLSRDPRALRQAMNGAHATGAVWGRILRHRERGEAA